MPPHLPRLLRSLSLSALTRVVVVGVAVFCWPSSSRAQCAQLEAHGIYDLGPVIQHNGGYSYPLFPSFYALPVHERKAAWERYLEEWEHASETGDLFRFWTRSYKTLDSLRQAAVARAPEAYVSRGRALARWLTVTGFSDFAEAGAYGEALAIPFGDMLAAVGIDADEQGWSEFLLRLELYAEQEEPFKEVLRELLDRINRGVDAALKRCTASPGFRMWYEVPAQEDLIVIAYRFRSASERIYTPRFSEFSTTPRVNECNWLPEPTAEGGKSVLLHGSVQRVWCVRPSPESITVRTRLRGHDEPPYILTIPTLDVDG